MTPRPAGTGRSFSPLRRARRWYRRLKYESADRPSSPWTTRVNWSLLVTGVLAILLSLLVRDIVRQPVETTRLDFEIIEREGGQMSDVFKLVQYFRNLDHFPAYSAVRRTFFPGEPPVSTVVEVSAMLPTDDILIEVEATAYLPLGGTKES